MGSRFHAALEGRFPRPWRSSGVASLRDRRATPRRVLLIEDNTDAREMLRMMLELAGHAVYDAPDGVRGLELLSVVRPDVGIIDIGLPRMDGYQVAKRIREDPHGRGMLLLALTGYSSTRRYRTLLNARVRLPPDQAGRPGSARAPARARTQAGVDSSPGQKDPTRVGRVCGPKGWLGRFGPGKGLVIR